MEETKMKSKTVEHNDSEVEVKNESDCNNDIIAMSNYMLADVRKEDIDDYYKLSLSTLAKINPLAMNAVSIIENVMKNSSSKGLYRITNLGKNDALKAVRGGQTFWGAIKRSDGTGTMAKLEKVSGGALILDPTVMMMSFALATVEDELGQITELSKKILSFLEHEKESEIESDLEILKKSITDFKYNLENEKYLANNQKQVMDIKRTASKNMLFYKKEIKDDLSKDKLFTTSGSMKSILDEVLKKFKYYRLSLYTYSFSTYIEIFLNGNYKSDYLVYKTNELTELNHEYSGIFDEALDYIKKVSNKSLEGNVLSGLGSAGKAIGSLAEKVKIKNVDNWLNEKGDNLKQSSQTIKDNFVNMFDEMKNTNSEIFINQITRIDSIYNKTEEIYFDNENVYLKTS